jgi:enoyl-CoA hydratase/carnithine racemase
LKIDMTLPVLFEDLVAGNGARIGVTRLNAERSLNALSLEMIDLLAQRLAFWAADPGIAIVVLEGTGDKAFSAGADLHIMHATMIAHHASPERDYIRANPYAAAFFGREYRLDYLIHTYPKPVLCWGHGIVMGGGVGLMSGASHRVLTHESRVAMPEITIGLFPDVGGSWLLERMPGATGLFLALTGARLQASDALFVKLADYCIGQSNKATVFERLTSHSADVGVGGRPPGHELDGSPFLDNELIVVGREPSTDLDGATWLLREAGSGTR